MCKSVDCEIASFGRLGWEQVTCASDGIRATVVRPRIRCAKCCNPPNKKMRKSVSAEIPRTAVDVDVVCR